MEGGTEGWRKEKGQWKRARGRTRLGPRKEKTAKIYVI